MADPERTRAISEEFPPELLSYFQEMFRVLAVQGGALSAGGMNLGRSRLGVVQEFSTSILRFIVGERLYEKNWENLDMSRHDYLSQVEEKLRNGELIVSEIRLGRKAKRLLTQLRIVYEWAKDVANTPHDGLFRWADSPIGRPVEIIARMLDPLADNRQVKREWKKLKANPEKLEVYLERFRLEVKDLVNPYRPEDFL